MIYSGPAMGEIPDVDLLTFLFESPNSRCTDDTPLHALASSPDQVFTKKRIVTLAKQIGYFLRNEYNIGAKRPGKDIVFTVSPGQPAMASVFYGVIIAEGIYSGVSYAGMPSEIAWQCKDGPGNVMVTGRECQANAIAAAKAIGMSMRNVLVLESFPKVRLTSVDGTVQCRFDKELDWRRITDRKELEDREIAIVYSSGTTSLPKGVMFSHRNFISIAVAFANVSRPIYDGWATKGEDVTRRTLGYMSTAHVGGIQTYFVNLPYEGGTVYWVPNFEYEVFINYCESLRITYFIGMPAIYIAIAKDSNIKDKLRYVREALVGAAPLSKGIQVAVTNKMPNGTLTQVWGLTETTGPVTLTPPGRLDTAGTLSPLLPGLSLRLVDDDGKDVAVGEVGEALVKGPSVVKGYHNCPKETRQAFTKDGWFKTGDILRMEGDLLHLVDRKKDIIKYYGLQVPPAELEGLLETHPLVSDAGVVGIKQEHTEVPRAYVSLIPAARDSAIASDLQQELQDYIERKVSDHKKLRGGLKFVECIPRSPTGKILRRELRNWDRARL